MRCGKPPPLRQMMRSLILPGMRQGNVESASICQWISKIYRSLPDLSGLVSIGNEGVWAKLLSRKFRRRCLILGASKQQTRVYQHVGRRRANFDSLSISAHHTSAQILEHQSVASYCRRGRGGKRLGILPVETPRARFGVRLDGRPTRRRNLGRVAFQSTRGPWLRSSISVC